MMNLFWDAIVSTTQMIQYRAVYMAFQTHAFFWNVQALSLQTTLFVTMGRIFDQNPNTQSIHQLLSETLAHPEFFSREVFRQRKMNLNAGSNKGPEWIERLVADAWIPDTASDLRYLKKALAPHARKFGEIYRPIRHNYFAHRVMETDKPISELFALTNREELGKILDFLHGLVNAIWHLYMNGHKPELEGRSYSHYNDKIKESVRKLIGKIADFDFIEDNTETKNNTVVR